MRRYQTFMESKYVWFIVIYITPLKCRNQIHIYTEKKNIRNDALIKNINGYRIDDESIFHQSKFTHSWTDGTSLNRTIMLSDINLVINQVIEESTSLINHLYDIRVKLKNYITKIDNDMMNENLLRISLTEEPYGRIMFDILEATDTFNYNITGKYIYTKDKTCLDWYLDTAVPLVISDMKKSISKTISKILKWEDKDKLNKTFVNASRSDLFLHLSKYKIKKHMGIK